MAANVKLGRRGPALTIAAYRNSFAISVLEPLYNILKTVTEEH